MLLLNQQMGVVEQSGGSGSGSGSDSIAIRAALNNAEQSSAEQVQVQGPSPIQKSP